MCLLSLIQYKCTCLLCVSFLRAKREKSHLEIVVGTLRPNSDWFHLGCECNKPNALAGVVVRCHVKRAPDIHKIETEQLIQYLPYRHKNSLWLRIENCCVFHDQRGVGSTTICCVHQLPAGKAECVGNRSFTSTLQDIRGCANCIRDCVRMTRRIVTPCWVAALPSVSKIWCSGS